MKYHFLNLLALKWFEKMKITKLLFAYKRNKMDCLKKIILLLLLLIVIDGCKQKAKDHSSSNSTIIESPSVVKNTAINEANQTWMASVNSKSESLLSIYDENAIKIIENQEELVGNNQIQDYYHSHSLTISNIVSDKVVMANENRGLEYEIGSFSDQENKKYKHLIIWKTEESTPKRVFEFVSEIETNGNDLAPIDARRKLWIELCNSNNSEKLVNELYSTNTLYYNHKPLVRGRESLIKEYDYMNNESYELTLTPIVSEMITNNLAYEIGQCSGSYYGKYIIIWKRNQDDKWEVFIDSNI